MPLRACLALVISALLCVALSWGQSGGQQRAGRLLPGAPIPVDREAELEEQLQRLKSAASGMGEQHPKLAETQQRISDLESELASLRAIPNPFNRLEEQGFEPQDIVEQLSERELRILVVRLAVDVKELRKRVAALEREPL